VHGRLLPALVAVAALAAPAAAHAAYAPQLQVKIDPTTPGTPPAITSTILQKVGETPNKTVRVSFPAGFTAPNKAVTVPICSQDQENARACPAESRIGASNATASLLGLPVKLDGSVFYGGPTSTGIKLIVFLDNQSLNQHVTVEGLITIRKADAGFDVTFDNLPNTLTTSFTLALDGAPRSLAVNPIKCGDFPFKAAFTSQKGETGTSSSSVTVAGCTPPKLILSPPDLEPSRLVAGAKRGATLTFSVSQAAQVVVTVKKAGGTRVAEVKVAARQGTNRVRGLGAKLTKPGRYAVSVVATAPDGQTAAREMTLTVAKPKAKLKRTLRHRHG
jgi:hypothetical protein